MNDEKFNSISEELKKLDIFLSSINQVSPELNNVFLCHALIKKACEIAMQNAGTRNQALNTLKDILNFHAEKTK